METTREKLAALPEGTKVVLHHGFGGQMPPGYQLKQREALDEGELELWVKRGRPKRR